MIPGKVQSTSFWNSTFRSLTERDFAWFFAGNFAFFMAIHMQFILYGYLAFDITESAKALGLVSAAITVPSLIASPFAGAIADRVDKRFLLASTQAFATLTSTALALLVLAGRIELWHIVAAGAGIGCVLSLNMPTRQALVPQLVPRQKLMNAVSLQMGVMNLTMIIAPVIAGLLISPLGVGWVFLISSVLFVAATAFEIRLPKHGMTGSDAKAGFMSEVGQGFGYIVKSPVLRLLLLANLLVLMFSFPVQQTLPVFARDVFDKGPAGLGILVAMSGLGGLAGAMVAANLDHQPRKGRLMFAAGALMGSLFAAFALAPSFAIALPLLALGASGQMFLMTTNNTVVLSTVPAEMRGRVMAIMSMAIGLTPLGVFPVTVAVDEAGAPAAIAVSSALMLGLLVLLFWRAPRLWNLHIAAPRHAELSPSQAAGLVAAGRLSQSEADHLAGIDAAQAPETPDSTAGSFGTEPIGEPIA